MITQRFRIEYDDPETGEPVTKVEDCTEIPGIASPYGVAEDMAYTLSDKGKYTITEVKE